MQKEIVESIREFFGSYLSRKVTDEEILSLHDKYTVDYEGMSARAKDLCIPYSELLKQCLVDHFADEIDKEDEVYRLYLAFINASTLVEAAITRFKESAEAILKSPHTGKVVDMVSSNTDLKVTVMEPALLKVFLDDALKACNGATLKEMVLRKDPTLSKVGSDDKPWYNTVRTDGRVTVDSIKRIREVFNPGLVSIADAKRIAEFVLEGHI